MKVLSINAGSNSLRYLLINMFTKKNLMKGHIDGIGLKRCQIKITIGNEKIVKPALVKDHLEAIILALKSLKKERVINSYNEIKAVGHRVVHGGEFYTKAVIIDENVLNNIKKLSELAPLHNPKNIAGILACKKVLPHTKQIAVFDTAYHHTIPKYAFMYGIPFEFYLKYGIRKYGFHGINHKYLAKQASLLLGKKDHEIITCHLGNGSSITAIKNGKSIDTTMGFTPLDGLMMGTRPGDLDPEIPLYLIKKGHYTIEEVENILNTKSGLLGITTKTYDVRDIREMAKKGNVKAKLALHMLSYKISFYIGGFSTILGDLDCLVFSGGIGENAWYIRARILDSIKHLGVKYDNKKNKKNEVVISTDDSKVKVYVIPANEELEIAKEVYSLLQ